MKFTKHSVSGDKGKASRKQESTPSSASVIGNRVLFLGAHCDDIEIGCGGTAAKLQSQGRVLAFAVATDCGKERTQEARNAAARLGLTEEAGTLFFGLVQDSRLAERQDVLKKWLETLVEKFQPDTVFLQHPDSHPDHETLYRVAVRVLHRETILTFPIPKLAAQSEKYIVPFTESFWTDITDFMAEKLALCTCHASQTGKAIYLDPGQIEDMARIAYRQRFGKSGGFAEAFHIHVIGSFLAGPALPRDPSAYLRQLSGITSHIDIRGLAESSGQAHRFPIEDLYIPLMTSGSEREPKLGGGAGNMGDAGAAHPELQQALQARTLVIVGDPGAGKTTFLNRITAALCRAWLGDTDALKSIGLAARPLPVLINVAKLAEHIAQCRLRHEGPTTGTDTPAWLPHFLGESSRNENWGLDTAYFRKHMDEGTALVMLDGLDEAPSRVVREQISQLVQNAARAYEHCRFVVTSRPAAYVEKAVLPHFTQVTIAPLTDPAIATFLEKWCAALFHETPGRAGPHCAQLLAEVRGSHIRKLARNPLMLTALAVVHWHEKKLPEQRAVLYESILKWLARSRKRRQGRPSDVQTLVLLRALALAMQDAPGKRKIQVPRHWAAEQIAPFWPDRKLQKSERLAEAEAYLVEEELDSGIVVARGNEIRFWHLTFQEYLAARALGAAAEKDQNKILLTQPAKLHSSEWRETVLLFAGVLHEQGPDKAEGMISTILDGLGKREKMPAQARCAGLLGAIMRDLAVEKFQPEDERFQGLMDRVYSIFDPVKSRPVPIKDAIAAAEALGQAGDRRFEPAERPKHWIKIEACTFKVAETDKSFTLAPYAIGKYPVTVLEYGEFIEAGGYTDTQWWTAGGHDPKVQEPEGWEDQQEHPTRPVTGVSWFEAKAYAAWCAATKFPGCHLVTDAEWERAAAGMEHRKYPWGQEEPTEHRANYGGKVGAPTPVGVYPCGATPDGIFDMAGNVWEWCEDKYDPKEEYRVLRGGSWGTHPDCLLASARNYARPDRRFDSVGFRVVCSSSP